MKQQPGDFKQLGFREAHLEKREQLIAAGLDPYPYSFSGAQRISDIIAASGQGLGLPVTAAGRIWARRDAKNMVFIDLRDDSGKIQIHFYKKDLSERAATILKCVDVGDILGVSGVVVKTGKEKQTLSIEVKSVEVLAKTVVPIPIGKETPEGVRDRLNDPESQYRERYLTWLLKDEERHYMMIRSRIIDSIRRFMRDREFLEVSTPAIEPIYGGAEARPFRTSIWALEGKEAFLRISPELYLKRYIVAGFGRVYTICQNFRNEGIDRSHNPEFTMMEWYEAYTDYEYQMTQFEALVAQVCMDIHGKTVISYQGVELDFTPPWRRISVLDALLQEGVDAANMPAQDLFAAASQSSAAAHDSWGVAVAALFEKLCEPKLVQPTFVIDHPIEISPLTKVKRGDPRLVERFEPFACSMELGNAYSELTDPVEQLARLRSQRRGKEGKDYEDHPLDADFIKAVGCGMPPTGGVGLGIDRLIMLLADAPSIRDVIPFPMVKSLTVP